MIRSRDHVVLDVPAKRYRIGELASFTGLSRQTLHNYTRWGLIHEVTWTAGGHRLYDEDAIHRLGRIVQLKRTCTMDQIRDDLDQRFGVVTSETQGVARE